MTDLRNSKLNFYMAVGNIILLIKNQTIRDEALCFSAKKYVLPS